jgi:protein SCO1
MIGLMKVLVAAMAVAVVACGCNRTPSSPDGEAKRFEVKGVVNEVVAPLPPGTKTFDVKGVVKEVLPASKQVRIEHEKIADYMDAMTMLFDVKNTNELAGLAPGDNISFRMIVTEDDGWIDRVTRLGITTPVVSTPPESFRRAREVEPLKVGQEMPNYNFTNEFGKPVSLADFKGKAVAFTFIFTRCPYPDYCPRMSKSFEAVQKHLKTATNGPTNWHLLSITIDPQFDTPTVLKNYAATYRYDSNHWSYVTGELIDITAIAEQFGLLFWRPDPNQPAGINHNLRTVVLTASGKVHKIFPENTWKPEDVAAAVTEAAKL